MIEYRLFKRETTQDHLSHQLYSNCGESDK